MVVLARFRVAGAGAPGLPLDELVGRTLATAGRAVLASGLAVAISLAGLLLLGDSLLSGMAVGGAIVVLVATAAGLTLVPALVATWHRAIPAPGARTGTSTGRGRAREAACGTRGERTTFTPKSGQNSPAYPPRGWTSITDRLRSIVARA